MIDPACSAEKGATFSEVMVAMALMAIGIMGAMGAYEAAEKRLGRDALAARALAMAESRIEAKRAVPWEQLLLDDLDHDGVPEVTMHDDGDGADRTAGDGTYSAMLQKDGVTVQWTVTSHRPGSLSNAGAVVIEAYSRYQSETGERDVHLATLRANPGFIGLH